MKIFFPLILLLMLSSCSIPKLYQANTPRGQQSFEQINFVDLVKKYVSKDKSGPQNIEGIYSVSIIVIKKSRGLFSSGEKERTVEQKEHYAQVAVIRDNARNNREFIEVPIDKDYLPSYAVRGEFTTLSEGNILVLKHFEPKGQVQTYSFTYDREKDILEGIRTETKGNTTYTYKINFVKLYPKQTAAEN